MRHFKAFLSILKEIYPFSNFSLFCIFPSPSPQKTLYTELVIFNTTLLYLLNLINTTELLSRVVMILKRYLQIKKKISLKMHRLTTSHNK